MDENITELKVDVGVLKSEVTSLCALCQKMDKIIEKIVDNQDRYLIRIYDDMEKRQQKINEDVKEVNDRIDNIVEKLQASEFRIMEEMKSCNLKFIDEMKDLKSEMNEKFDKNEKGFEKINQWRWVVAGGIIAISWLISNLDSDIIIKLLK